MEKLFNRFANATAKITGRPWTFIACLALVAGWAASGPLFSFSETWQLVINTGTTIVTFLMVFLIQNTQNRDAAAMHAKLDELVYAVKKADARFIGIEHLTDKELAVILDEVEQRALAVHAGKPARAVRGKPAVRIEDLATNAAPQAGVAK
ncbi:low affinity iron permease family protein [Brevundimonas sp. S30B]|uniref:low affinity iron permease family protein n=1 Tax=unclassified Brevundimonas TaxID=2622653 RepID=UPI001072CD4B|nr:MULTISPECIES: low affinity iron permease family protein [unclassified Brevundimonas]QBX38314.1 low affinity iron permease family protein [Brevundimonas sp. MF30-B]TFW01549.1 low affinity iron permease family protein [Brevundimonas sp. S30B]